MPLSLDEPLAGLPRPGERNVTIRVKRAAERALRRGHPWLFDQAIDHQSHEGAPGDLAVLFDTKRKLLGLGLYDPGSPIRVRVLHVGKPRSVDEGFFAERVREAAERRAPLAETATDGYRLLHGENDGLGGLVLDRYADTLVLKLYSAAWVPRLPELLPALSDLEWRGPTPERLIVRTARALRGVDLGGLVDGQALCGPPGPWEITFRENGLRFVADPFRGQKTGFFLDQRDNRARVEALARGRRTLNAFAYSGGFSLYAARGGAPEVVSLDSSAPALEAAERHFALNAEEPGVRACAHRTLCQDAFEAFTGLAEAKERFGLVVVDPPSFAKQKEAVGRALQAYARLVRLALAVLEPGGTLVFASCSSRVDAAAFRDNVEQTARAAGRPLSVQEETGHALDHPIAFPEGAYLKCLYAVA